MCALCKRSQAFRWHININRCVKFILRCFIKTNKHAVAHDERHGQRDKGDRAGDRERERECGASKTLNELQRDKIMCYL